MALLVLPLGMPLLIKEMLLLNHAHPSDELPSQAYLLAQHAPPRYGGACFIVQGTPCSNHIDSVTVLAPNFFLSIN